MNTIKRIENIIAHKKMSIRSFERFIGVSVNVLQAAIKKNSGVKDDTLSKILEACPDINPVWLLTGKDAMLLEGDTELAAHAVNAMKTAKEQYKVHVAALEKLLDAKDEIIAMQKEKIQALQHNGNNTLEHISKQNKKIIDYFETWEIEKIIKDAKEQARKGINEAKDQ